MQLTHKKTPQYFFSAMFIAAALASFFGGVVDGAASASADAGYPQDGGTGASTTGSGFTATVEDAAVKTGGDVTGSLTYQNGATLSGSGTANDRMDWHGTITDATTRANWKVKLSGKLTCTVEVINHQVDTDPLNTYSSSGNVQIMRECSEATPPQTSTLTATASPSIAPEVASKSNFAEFKNPAGLANQGSQSKNADFYIPTDTSTGDTTLQFYYQVTETGSISTHRPEKEVKAHSWVSTALACIVEAYDGTTLITSFTIE